MNSVCPQCGKEFEAIRATARFCSTACRVKANREFEKKSESVASQQEEESIVRTTVLPDPDILTPDGQVRQVWDRDNPIPNLEGGYFHIGQTQEEYLANLPEEGMLWGGIPCPHPALSKVYSKCGDCGALIPYVHTGEATEKKSDKTK